MKFESNEGDEGAAICTITHGDRRHLRCIGELSFCQIEDGRAVLDVRRDHIDALVGATGADGLEAHGAPMIDTASKNRSIDDQHAATHRQ